MNQRLSSFGVQFFILILGVPFVYLLFFTSVFFPQGLINTKLDYLLNTNYSRDLILQSATSEIATEYQEITDLKNFERAHAHDMSIAYVIGRDIDVYNAITINKGEKDGIRIGDIVIAGDGVVVGKILSSTTSRSTVILLNDPFVSLTVKLLGKQEEIGVTKGNFSSDITIDLIPQNTEIKEGDVVVTSSLTGESPDGLIVGIVKRISGSSNQLFKQAIIESPVNVFNFATVGVIHSRHDNP
ncbi:rod shape-determining protein MreC [Candidatus Falkowbacteria bacterium]|nr:rod shape-determining protein MreC [Candidatus Falkowbacteria bacterium]